MLLYKYIVKNVCHKLGYTATFMPKPLFGDNGSGMHCHQSLWKGDTPLFFDANGYALISETARHYIGGLIAHAPALLAICAPTTNSYRRLVPGFEAPVNLMYSAGTARHLPDSGLFQHPKSKRVDSGARPVGQPVPGLLRHAHGRPRRDQEQDGAGGSILFWIPSRPAMSMAEKARYGLADGSGTEFDPLGLWGWSTSECGRWPSGSAPSTSGSPGPRSRAPGGGSCSSSAREGQQRRRVGDEPADVVPRGLRDQRVAVGVEEERRVALHSDWWQCMPEPLSPKSGFGMNVAV